MTLPVHHASVCLCVARRQVRQHLWQRINRETDVERVLLLSAPHPHKVKKGSLLDLALRRGRGRIPAEPCQEIHPVSLVVVWLMGHLEAMVYLYDPGTDAWTERP
jgi:hypothetical protein